MHGIVKRKYVCGQTKYMQHNISSDSMPAEDRFDKDFKPRGAIAFFILLIILGLVIWFSIYFLMLERV